MQIVRTTLAETDIHQKILEHYAGCLPNSYCVFEYRGLNDIYRFINGGTTLFFKIYARKDICREDIEGEIEVVDYLKRSGLSVAYPVPMKNEEYLLPIELPEGNRFGVLFTEAKGVPCSSQMQDQQEIIVAISRLASNMHTMLDTMPTHPNRWKLDEHLFLDRSMEILGNYHKINPDIDLPFIGEVVKELKQQIQAKASSWHWGLCHADFYTGNIHRQNDGTLTLFDFDFCGYGWRAYDVSPFLGTFSAGVGPDAVDKRQRRLDFFLQEYRSRGGFSQAELEAVYKIFVPFRRIFNLGYLYEAFNHVWGNKLRSDLITHDTQLLREWVNYYWWRSAGVV